MGLKIKDYGGIKLIIVISVHYISLRQF